MSLPATNRRWVAVIVCLPLGGRRAQWISYKAGDTKEEAAAALAAARVMGRAADLYVTGYVTQSLRRARYYRNLWRKASNIPAPMMGERYEWQQIKALAAINHDYRIAEGKLRGNKEEGDVHV